MVFRHRKRAAIHALGLHGVRDADEYNGDIGVLCGLLCFLEKRFVGLCGVRIVAGRVGDIESLCSLERACDLIGVHMRAAAALKTRSLRKLADEREFLAAL